MATLYALLGVEPDASQEAIEQAYAEQRARYAPEQVADLDPHLQRVATERSAEIERAYRILADPERRRQYDSSLANGTAPGKAPQRGLTPRERLFAVAGALLGVGLIALFWVLTGQNGSPQGQAMGEMNRPAPPFTAPALAGGTVRLEDYRGQVVLLNFWGTWCEPCKRELPALQAAHEQLGSEGLVIIGVNLTDDEKLQGRDTAQIQSFLNQFGVTYPVALDEDGSITNAYRVFPLPTSFFIDPDGAIRYMHIGELTLADVQATFTRMRGEMAGRSPT